jgi:hypothetical protein
MEEKLQELNKSMAEALREHIRDILRESNLNLED